MRQRFNIQGFLFCVVIGVIASEQSDNLACFLILYPGIVAGFLVHSYFGDEYESIGELLRQWTTSWTRFLSIVVVVGLLAWPVFDINPPRNSGQFVFTIVAACLAVVIEGMFSAGGIKKYFSELSKE